MYCVEHDYFYPEHEFKPCPGCSDDPSIGTKFSCENCGEMIFKQEQLTDRKNKRKYCIHCTKCILCKNGWISWKFRKERLCYKCGIKVSKQSKDVEVLSDEEEMENNVQQELNELYELKNKEEERLEKDLLDLKSRYESDIKLLNTRYKENINKINKSIGKKFKLREKINLKRLLRYKEIEERNKLLPALEVLKRNINIVKDNIKEINM